jgi:hypothetical protein
MPRNIVKLEARKPGQNYSEETMRLLENKIAAKGEAVPGQAHEIMSSQAHSLTSSTGKGTKKDPRIRKDGTAMRSTTIHLPVPLAKRLAVHCANKDQRQSEAIADALTAFLDAKSS